jgi:hypothetical protein
MPSSARTKIAEALSQWVERATPACLESQAHPEQKLLAVALEALGKRSVPQCADYDCVVETLSIMCTELGVRLHVSTTSAFSETLKEVINKWMGTDRHLADGSAFPLSSRIDGCARFSCATSYEHVKRLVDSLVERDYEDFVYDATELVMRLVSEESDANDSEDSEDSEDSDDGVDSIGSKDSDDEDVLVDNDGGEGEGSVDGSDDGEDDGEEEEEEEEEEEDDSTSRKRRRDPEGPSDVEEEEEDAVDELDEARELLSSASSVKRAR